MRVAFGARYDLAAHVCRETIQCAAGMLNLSLKGTKNENRNCHRFS